MYKYLIVACALVLLVGCSAANIEKLPGAGVDDEQVSFDDRLGWGSGDDDGYVIEEEAADVSVSDVSDDDPISPVRIATTYFRTTTDQFRAYEQQIRAADGSGSYVWRIDGLPSGLSVENYTARIIKISGKADTAGSFEIFAEVCDAENLADCAHKTYTLEVKKIEFQIRLPEMRLPSSSCGGSLKIETVYASHLLPDFGDYEVNNFTSTLGAELNARFKVTGGTPPYNWTLVSAAEDFWGLTDAGITSWATEMSTTVVENDSFEIDGRIDHSLMYCSTATVVDADGTATPVYADVPSMENCGGSTAFKENLTVIVTDSCGMQQTARKIFNLDLNNMYNKVKDLIGVAMRIDFDDYDGDNSYVVVELWSKDANGRDVKVAETPNAQASKWGENGKAQITAPIFPLPGKEDVLLEDVHRVSLFIDQKINATGPCFMDACYKFDVSIDYVYIFGKQWYYFSDPRDDIFWEVPTAREKRENFTNDAVWLRQEHYSDPGDYGYLKDDEWVDDVGY